MKETEVEAAKIITCPNCDGTGIEADYVGLEMRPVAVECSQCRGTGVIAISSPKPAPPVEPAQVESGDIDTTEKRLRNEIERLKGLLRECMKLYATCNADDCDSDMCVFNKIRAAVTGE